MKRSSPAAAALFCVLGLPAAALTLDLPLGARLAEETTALGSDQILATGPFADGALPHEVISGTARVQAWQIPSQGLTTQQILAPLAAQLELQGFDMVFTCADRACGGFDFRFELDVLPAPAMYVDLGDFRYFSATSDDAAVSLLISRTSTQGFIQLATMTPENVEPQVSVPEPLQTTRVEDAPAGTLVTKLDQLGHAILWDLAFEPGSSRLGTGPFASLVQLSGFLKSQPGLSVALVGHTDSVGSLSNNIALSKRRARSVRSRLIEDYGVRAAQVEAEGMGYLAPIADNRTLDGREANRRVEVVIISTE